MTTNSCSGFGGEKLVIVKCTQRWKGLCGTGKMHIKLQCTKSILVYINTYALPLIKPIHYAILSGWEARRIYLKNV
jgi:hypothetical protein